jgi:hypothetical protein
MPRALGMEFLNLGDQLPLPRCIAHRATLPPRNPDAKLGSSSRGNLPFFERLLNSHPFNNQIELLLAPPLHPPPPLPRATLPSSSKRSQDAPASLAAALASISGALSNSARYYRVKMHLEDLLSPAFLQKYVRGSGSNGGNGTSNSVNSTGAEIFPHAPAGATFSTTSSTMRFFAVSCGSTLDHGCSLVICPVKVFMRRE